MRRDSVLTWLLREMHANPQTSVLSGGAAWLGRIVTYQEIADDLGVDRRTIQRDLEDIIKEGFVSKRIRQHGIQLGLIQVGQNVLPQPVSGRTKCPTSEPLIISSSSSLSSLVSTKTKEGSKIGGVGEREKGTKRQKVVWEDLVVLANSPESWQDLEAVDRFGFSKACEERMFGHYPGRGEERVGYIRLMRIRKELGSRKGATRTVWPSVALVRALAGWNGKDRDGRWIQDTAGYLRNKAHFIAVEELRSEWETWREEDDKRRAETRGPEAAQVQALLDGLSGRMQMPTARGMNPEVQRALDEERGKR